jgi:hypothetical protein
MNWIWRLVDITHHLIHRTRQIIRRVARTIRRTTRRTTHPTTRRIVLPISRIAGDGVAGRAILGGALAGKDVAR